MIRHNPTPARIKKTNQNCRDGGDKVECKGECHNTGRVKFLSFYILHILDV